MENKHKRFRAIVDKYGLDKPDMAEEIAKYMTSSDHAGFRLAEFAAKFKMSKADAKDFLEWIYAGIKFKEEHIDEKS